LTIDFRCFDRHRTKSFPMELRQLRSLSVLAEELHYGHAADRLGVAQPALSRQIQQLEAELGVQLLKRSSRSVVLTEAGRQFAQDIAPALRQLERAAADVSGFAHGKRGNLRVGFSSNLEHQFVPKLIQKIRLEAPEAKTDLRELSVAEQIRQLNEGEIDIGLTTLPVADPALIVRRLFSEPLVVLVPSESRFAHLSAISLDDLAEEPFIMCPRYRQSGYHEFIRNLAAKAGFRPKVAYAADTKSTAAALVARGLGVSLVPQSATATATGGVIGLPISDHGVVVEIGIVWRRENMSPLFRLFIDCSVDLARTRDPGKPQQLVA
jgi:DNA-binding transcriptional LysR family regulator